MRKLIALLLLLCTSCANPKDLSVIDSEANPCDGGT